MLPWILFVIAAVAAVLIYFKRAAGAPAQVAGAKVEEDTKRLEAARAELQQAKDEIQRKQKQLDEARDEAKKKLRREGKKAERENEETKMTTDPRDVEIQGLKKGMAALESQLNAAKREAEQKAAELERLLGETKGQAEGAERQRSDARTREDRLAEEVGALKRTLDELRAAKRKENERPDVPGTSIDLKALPPEAVQELARFFRKGEEFERLYHVSQGQTQLAQDRYLELQRRYYAVCRELALAAGVPPGNDAEAKSAAEGLVKGTDQAARTQAPQTARPAGEPGAPGEGQKKRRRRRRRRKPGAPGEPAAAGAAAEGAEGAESDEGGDEGDEGDEAARADEGSGSSDTPAAGGAEPSSSAPASA